MSCYPAVAWATTGDLSGYASTYIDESAPGTSFDSSQQINVGYNESNGEQKRGLLHFVQELPAGTTINSAALFLYLESCSGSPVGISVGPLSSNWEENTSWNAYNPSWAFDGATTFTSNCAPGTWQSVDVTWIFNNWWTGARQNYGFGITGSPYGSTWSRQFSSVHSSSMPHAPYIALDVTFHPAISNISVSNISKTAADVSWSTTAYLDCNGKVEYGTSTAYGQETTQNQLGREHVVSVTGLSPGTIYHYKVTSVDNWGDSVSSGDGTFTTATDTAPGSVGTAPSTPSVSSGPGTTSIDANGTEKSVDSSIAPPILKWVNIQGKTYTPTVDTTLTSPSSELILLTGEAIAGQDVIVIIGDRAYKATAGKQGMWSIGVNTRNFVAGEYIVKGQAQDRVKNKGSVVVDFFKLKISPPIEAFKAADSNKNSISGSNLKKFFLELSFLKLPIWLWLAVAILLLLLIVLIIFLIIRSRKRKKNTSQRIE